MDSEMSELYIIESDMKFGPFQDEDLFEIEKSPVYKKIKHGITNTCVIKTTCLRMSYKQEGV